MITITPAYGRDYKNKGEVLSDLFDNVKDFKMHQLFNESYCNIDDLKHLKVGKVQVRYNKLQKSFMIDTNELTPPITEGNN